MQLFCFCIGILLLSESQNVEIYWSSFSFIQSFLEILSENFLENVTLS